MLFGGCGRTPIPGGYLDFQKTVTGGCRLRVNCNTGYEEYNSTSSVYRQARCINGTLNRQLFTCFSKFMQFGISQLIL